MEIKIGIIIAILLIVLIIIVISMRSRKPSKIIKESETKSINVSSSIFYHEDDYRQVEIIPAENFNELIRQAENIQDFAEKHFEQGGYTDMVVREENGFKLKSRGIKPAELDLILSELPINRFTDVSTGIRPGEMNSENTLGYGKNYNGIFFDFESDSVTSIWIAGSIPTDNENVIGVLNKIGQEWNLLLMDWNSLQLVDLKNREQIKKYIN